MKDICYIIGAGDCNNIYINQLNKGYVIAADGGKEYLEKCGITPDMIIGDFDSLGYIPKHRNIIKLPVEKDVTDMFAAVNEAMEMGYDKFIIYGGLGGRLDHTIANCQLLKYISKKGCIGFIVGENTAITSVYNGKIEFCDEFKGLISVFSIDETSKGVTIEGFKYELKDGELKNDYPLGVSNEFAGKRGIIEVEDGTLLVHFETLPKTVCDGLGMDIVFGGKLNG